MYSVRLSLLTVAQIFIPSSRCLSVISLSSYQLNVLCIVGGLIEVIKDHSCCCFHANEAVCINRFTVKEPPDCKAKLLEIPEFTPRWAETPGLTHLSADVVVRRRKESLACAFDIRLPLSDYWNYVIVQNGCFSCSFVAILAAYSRDGNICGSSALVQTEMSQNYLIDFHELWCKPSVPI